MLILILILMLVPAHERTTPTHPNSCAVSVSTSPRHSSTVSDRAPGTTVWVWARIMLIEPRIESERNVENLMFLGLLGSYELLLAVFNNLI